jgi:class 3 adenylate cyclase
LPGTDVLTLEQFLAIYPWPEGRLSKGKPLEWLWHFELEAVPEDLWRHLIDTSRFNRALDLARMEFEERDGELYGEAANLGIKQQWREVPWQWVTGHFLESAREYSRGFAHYVRSVYHLVELPGGRVSFYVYFGWIARSVFGSACIRMGMPWIKKGYGRVLCELAEQLQRPDPEIYRAPPTALSPDAGSRVEAIRASLGQGGLATDVVDKLVELVTTGDDMDVYRVQMRERAAAWGVDEDELLRVCLHATRLGLLDMSWDVICPHCRGVRREAMSLGEVPELGACEVCEIDFTTDKDNAIEITFHVHPGIREVPKLFYCSAEASSKEHIQLQIDVKPGETRKLPTRIAAGRYRIRVKGDKDYHFLDVASDEEDGAFSWRASGTEDDFRTGPSPVAALVNDTDDVVTFVIENALWSDNALRPARLFNFQEFRDLFSEEYLSADVQLSIGEQTIIFTDMIGSTEFYANHGDPDAFMKVKHHFTDVFHIVGHHRGAVVKTIGDAVMASFGSPLDAVRASKAIHECFHAERDDTPIRVRISMHAGSCIAVKLNTNIDYFGGTVNIAAKLQACCEGGQVAMSQVIIDAPGVLEFLEAEDAKLEDTTLSHRALSDDVAVKRWTVW